MTVKQQFRRRAFAEEAMTTAVFFIIAASGQLFAGFAVMVVLDLILRARRRRDRQEAEQEERERRLRLRESAERSIRLRHGEFN